MKCPDKMFEAYVTCALWSSTGDDGAPFDMQYDVGDIADETLKTMRADCDAFYAVSREAIDGAQLSRDAETAAGHDFWLTRNGHGAGFWDGDWPEPQGAMLAEAAKAFGNVDLYVGDDGKIYA